MKSRKYIALLIIALSLFTVGCGNKEELSGQIEEVTDLPDAVISIPSTYIGKEAENLTPVTPTPSDESEPDVSASEDSATVTYQIDGQTRTELVNQIAAELQDSIDAILNDKYYYPDVQNITVNENGSEFTIYLTCDTPNLYESTLMMSFYTIGNRYQIYNGVPSEEAVTTVIYINSETGAELARTDSTSITQ